MRRPLLVTLIIAIVVGASLAVAWFWFSAQLGPADEEGNAQRFTIESGQSSESIATSLDQAGLIRSAWAFRIYTALEGLSSGLQAGTYELSPASKLSAVARELASGKTLDDEIKVVIPEGLTNDQLAEQLAEEFAPYQETGSATRTKAELKEAFLQEFSGDDLDETDYSFLADRPRGSTLEGWLFPDTYFFFKTATPDAVRKRLLDTFDEKIPSDLRAETESIGRAFYDVLTLASILEKELRTTQDRRMAADLFWRRLDSGMALQSDATVNYLTKKSRLQPTLDDLKIESPYNTYLQPGLPPGPISNPGRDAIDAALNPTPNEYVYYLNDSSGKTHFAKTYAEHLANKAQYLK
jgi:UPF0755 protein